MALVSFTACSGAPGVTTLAHTLAGCWPRRAVLVEADPDGGRLAARCGIPVRPGLVDLAAVTRSRRLTSDDLARVSQRTDSGVEVVVAHPAADQVRSVLDGSVTRIAHALAALDDIDVLVDAGRARPASEAAPLLLASSQVVIVSGTRLEDVAALVHRRSWLDPLQSVTSVVLVVTAAGEHSAADVAQAARLPLLGVRPGRSARRSSDRGRRREAQWVRSLGSALVERATGGLQRTGGAHPQGERRDEPTGRGSVGLAVSPQAPEGSTVIPPTGASFGLPSGPARPGPVRHAEVGS